MISSNKFFSLNKSETPGVNLSSQRWIENSLFPEIFLNWIHSLHFNHVLFTCLTWLSPFSCFLTFFTYLKCYMLWIVMGTIAELGAVLPNPFDLLWSTAQRCFIRTLLSQVNAVDTLLIACDVLRDISWDFSNLSNFAFSMKYSASMFVCNFDVSVPKFLWWQLFTTI